MAGRKQEYDPTEIIEALRKTRGMVYLAAELIGCAPKTIYNYAARYKEVAGEIEKQDGIVDDTAELRLINAIYAGEPWAIKYRLSTKGRKRGYIEQTQHEISGPDGGPIMGASITLEEWRKQQKRARSAAEKLLKDVDDARDGKG